MIPSSSASQSSMTNALASQLALIGVRRANERNEIGAKMRTKRRYLRTVIKSKDKDFENDSNNNNNNNNRLAPAKPNTANGQMLEYILSTDLQNFDAAMESVLEKLSDEIDSAAKRGGQPNEAAEKTDRTSLTLYKRIEDIKRMDRRRAVEDAMYCAVIHKFMTSGVDMLPPLNDETFWKTIDLTKLTTGVHSSEALEMVRDHLMAALGPEAANAWPSQLVRMSKLQAAQVYAASIMFGYFVRRVDKRFQLDRALGTLPQNPMDSAKALENVFNAASAMDSMDEAEDDPTNYAGDEFFGGFNEEERAKIRNNQNQRVDTPENGKLTLKQYVQTFNGEILAKTARIVSLEGVALAERQTGALFGSLEDLQKELMEAVGDNATTPQELMQRVQEVVANNDVETLTLPYAAQRRLVLEAVAFGSFLRDAEATVEYKDERLLTPTVNPNKRGGGGGSLPPGWATGGPSNDDNDGGVPV